MSAKLRNILQGLLVAGYILLNLFVIRTRTLQLGLLLAICLFCSLLSFLFILTNRPLSKKQKQNEIYANVVFLGASAVLLWKLFQ